EPRRAPAAGDACRAQGRAAPIQHHHDLRDSRPDRGDGARRPHRAHAQGPDRAGRYADGDLSQARHDLRRVLRGEPADEFPERAGGGRTRQAGRALTQGADRAGDAARRRAARGFRDFFSGSGRAARGRCGGAVGCPHTPYRALRAPTDPRDRAARQRGRGRRQDRHPAGAVAPRLDGPGLRPRHGCGGRGMSVTVDAARAILRGNDRGGYTVPTAGLYPYQWNWDAAFVAMGWITFDEPRAWREFERLIEGQWADGMVPHIIFHGPKTEYFPGPDVWKTRHTVPTSGISQPPVLATAVRHCWERARDRARAEAHAAALYPKILAWHRWWASARDP